jgi:hypothetical protein
VLGLLEFEVHESFEVVARQDRIAASIVDL